MRKKQAKREGVWQVQEAKAKLSALVQAADRKPQVITVNGRPKVVVLSYRHFWAVILHYFTGKDILEDSPERLSGADQIIRQAMKDARHFLMHSGR